MKDFFENVVPTDIVHCSDLLDDGELDVGKVLEPDVILVGIVVVVVLDIQHVELKLYLLDKDFLKLSDSWFLYYDLFLLKKGVFGLFIQPLVLLSDLDFLEVELPDDLLLV